MLKNYIKTALRNILKNKTSSIINIIGLAIGLASSFIILLYVYHELSFDNYPENKKNTYRIITYKDKYDTYSPRTPYLLAPTLTKDFAEIDKITRIKTWPTVMIQNDETYIAENDFLSADNDIFSIFSYEILHGDPKSLLIDPYSVVLTESNAKKYFGNTNPVGQLLSLKIRNVEFDLNITGIIKDIPICSSLNAGFISTIEFGMRYTENNLRAVKTPWREAWDFEDFLTYISFNEKINTEYFEQKLESFSSQHIPDKMGQKFVYSLQALKDIYLGSSGLSNNPTSTGNLFSIYIFTAIAIIIIFIAGANYTILTISRDQRRNKEMCIRKVSGAKRSGIVKQLLSESILVSLISLPFAFIIIEIFLPDINTFLRTNLNIYADNFLFILIFIFISVFIGFIAGLYISLYLSAFKPIDLLKGKLGKGRTKFFFRRILITMQIIIFVALIFCTGVIRKQINYSHKRDLGFNKESLIIIQSPNPEFVSRFEVFTDEIKKYPGVINVCGGLRMPPKNDRSMGYIYKGGNTDEPYPIEVLYVDHNFIKTFEIDLIEGRDFNSNYNRDSSSNIIVNETAVKMLGFDNPVGEKVGLERIIGVIKDFNVHSLHEKIEPLMLYHTTSALREIAVQIDINNAERSINHIKDVWTELNPDKIFDYKYFNDALDNLYVSENKIGDIAWIFTLISVLIASMGLFGMSAFVASHKAKEIGIRKVLGSSVSGVLKTISLEYIILCGIANIIALPISWFIMTKWLQRFEYKTNIDIWIYIVAIVLSLLIVLLTMSFKTIMAANSDPADVLRYE